MDLDALVHFLKARLTEPMPGMDASMEMFPSLVNGERIKIKHDDNAKEAAVIILLYQDGDTVRFPIIQRPIYPGVHSGQMALPGGKSEETDRDLIETALREMEEEIGVPAEDVDVIGSLSSFFVAVSNFQILPVIGLIRNQPEYIPQESEVADIISADVSHLMSDDYLKEKEMVVTGGVTLRSPYFDLEGRTVWGATSMMLNEFKAILKEFDT
ncbi:MAG: CoA pyrophosphatase [Cytophagales bacterium]|nr:CoA pyrophosphatase [Cytophagales bacterium]